MSQQDIRNENDLSIKDRTAMKKELYFILILTTIVLTLKAQTHTLSGTVCDENGALPFATVRVWQGNDTVKATYGITDKQGDFTLRGLNEGHYNGMVKFTGFEPMPFSVNLDKVCDWIRSASAPMCNALVK